MKQKRLLSALAVAALLVLVLGLGYEFWIQHRGGYDGRNGNAPWRAAAAARIERFRKANVDIFVTDAQGRPVPQAGVELAQTRQEFPFGSAVPGERLVAPGPDGKNLQSHFLPLFTCATPENELKWPEYLAHPAVARATVSWLHDHDVMVRGHNLVWPSWEHVPAELKAQYQASVASEGSAVAGQRLQSAILEHIGQEVGAFKGQCAQWDVVNEPGTNHELTDLLPPDAMLQWLRAAHTADPGALLVINETGLFLEDSDAQRQEQFFKLIQGLKKQGAPIDAIGFESHMEAPWPMDPQGVVDVLQKFSQLGLPILITEFDFSTVNRQLQADYTRDFYTAAYSCPKVSAILMWGFWDGAHWKNDAPLYNLDWSLKPSGTAWLQLVKRDWWTSTSGFTNAQGQWSQRAFPGRYRVIVRVGGRKKQIMAAVPLGGTVLHVTM